MVKSVDIATCIGCGCTDMDACDGGCSWLRLLRPMALGVCSECPAHVARFDGGRRDLSTQARLEVDMRKEFGA